MDIQKLMQQAQKMQRNMEKAQSELQNKSFSAEAGGGKVKVKFSGNGSLEEIKIDPNLLEAGDAEMLEDLILVAARSAQKAAKEEANSALSQASGGLGDLSGLGM